jgi:YHS domain-containing protein
MRRWAMAAGALALAVVVVGVVLMPVRGTTRGGDSTVAAVTTLEPDPEMAGVCQRSCATHAPYDEADVAAQPGAAVGQLTRCPVSGVVFTVDQNGTAVTHGGRTWYLCCGGCERKFRQDPARFTGV